MVTKLTNTSRTPLGLPSGEVLQPGATSHVHGFEPMRSNAVVAAWLRAGVLKAEVESPVLPAVDEKDRLIEQLAALGVRKNRRSSVESLREALALASGVHEPAAPEPQA